MKIKDHTLGTWFNQKRFGQRKAKYIALSQRFDHRLSRYLNHLLFKLLPSEWYLRMQGIEPYYEPCTTVTITYELYGEVRMSQVEFGSARAVVQMFPLFLKHGFITRPVKGEDRYAILPYNILEIAWYDPVLQDYFCVR